MSEDPTLLQNQQAAAALAEKAAMDAATAAYQQGLLHNQSEATALQAAIAAADNSLKALGIVTNLQGPRNAFQQQAMEVGLNNLGYSNAIDALAGRYSIPSFGQQFAAPQAQSISTIAGDMAANGGNSGTTDPVTAVMNNLFGQLGWTTPASTTFGGSGSGGSSSSASWAPVSTNDATPQAPAAAGAPTASGTTASSTTAPANDPTNGGTYMPTDAQRSDMLAALPNPNQIDVRQWNQMSPDTQQFILGAYSTKGYSTGDVQNAIQKSAPQFAAPKFGSVVGG